MVVEPADTDSQLPPLSQKMTTCSRRSPGSPASSKSAATTSTRRSARPTPCARRTGPGGADRGLEQKVDQLTSAAVTAPPPPQPVAPQATAPAAPSDDPLAAFAAARQAYLTRDYASAEAGFRDFLTRFGDTARGPEAHYFLGRVLLDRQAFADAAAQEVAAIRLWPQTVWAPEAVLDLSRALIGMRKPADACATLAELDRRYPKASPDVRAGATAARGQAQCS